MASTEGGGDRLRRETLAIGAGYCEVDGKDRVVVLTQSAQKP